MLVPYHCTACRFQQHHNFATFGKAMVTLWRCATGDNWEDMFFAARVRHDKVAPVFFLSFMVFCSMVMVNLFIAVILVSRCRHHSSSVFMLHLARHGHIDSVAWCRPACMYPFACML